MSKLDDLTNKYDKMYDLPSMKGAKEPLSNQEKMLLFMLDRAVARQTAANFALVDLSEAIMCELSTGTDNNGMLFMRHSGQFLIDQVGPIIEPLTKQFSDERKPQ